LQVPGHGPCRRRWSLWPSAPLSRGRRALLAMASVPSPGGVPGVLWWLHWRCRWAPTTPTTIPTA
jgi:hypothetical protein